MKWKKASPKTIAWFDALVAAPGAKRGLLFGCPTYVLNGERYATLFGDELVLRLSEEDTAALMKKGARPFEPIKGRRSKQSIVAPEMPDRALKSWVAKAVKHAKAA